MQSQQTGERLPISEAELGELRDAGYPTHTDGETSVVTVPHPIFVAEQARRAAKTKTKNRARRKQADSTRRRQRS